MASNNYLKPQFLKPNVEYIGSSVVSNTNSERLNDVENEFELAKFNSNSDMAIDVQRQQLPIFKNRNHILYALETNRVVIVVGETGSGKSTQLPQYLMESGWTNSKQMIGITEPRRIAAINLAKRICDEKGCILGNII